MCCVCVYASECELNLEWSVLCRPHTLMFSATPTNATLQDLFVFGVLFMFVSELIKLGCECRPGVRCVVCGVWCMVYGVWCMVYGVWCMVYGVWCTVYSVWCMCNDGLHGDFCFLSWL